MDVHQIQMSLINKMMCEKKPLDVGIAVFVLTIIVFSFGSTYYGLYRYAFGMVKDEKSYTPWFDTNHLILAGNILQVASLAGVLYFTQYISSPLAKLVIISSVFLLMIIILYLTNYDSSDTISDWAGMVLLFIDLYVKVTAVFMGFGVCTIEQVPSSLAAMGRTLTGGNKRR
jgi:hypothetical protein